MLSEIGRDLSRDLIRDLIDDGEGPIPPPPLEDLWIDDGNNFFLDNAGDNFNFTEN